jgi:hypothetical protein
MSLARAELAGLLPCFQVSASGPGTISLDLLPDRLSDGTFTYLVRDFSAQFIATPEPSTWLLLGSGLAGMMLWQRRWFTRKPETEILPRRRQ